MEFNFSKYVLRFHQLYDTECPAVDVLNNKTLFYTIVVAIWLTEYPESCNMSPGTGMSEGEGKKWEEEGRRGQKTKYNKRNDDSSGLPKHRK